MEGHQIGKEDEVVGTIRGQAHQAGQGPRNRDHTRVSQCGTPAAAKKKSDTQRLVYHSRKGMRGVHCDWRQQKVEFFLAILFDKSARPGIEFVQSENPDSMTGKLGAQLVVPAVVLVVYKLVGIAGDDVALFHQRKTVGSGLGVSIFDLLDQSGHAYFEKFIQIAGGYGKEFQAFEQRILLVLRFFEDTPVEGQPGSFPVDVIGRIVEREASHDLAETLMQSEETTHEEKRRLIDTAR
jgi:hypothetical protein